jgi:hypothetical protein
MRVREDEGFSVSIFLARDVGTFRFVTLSRLVLALSIS